MVDEVVPVATADNTPAAAPVVAPVAEPTVITPVTEPVAPVAEAAPIAEPVIAPEPAKPEATTVLGAEPKPAVDPAAPTAAEPEPTPAKEGSPSDEAPLPTYEPFTMPEGATVDEAKLGDFTKSLGTLEQLITANPAEAHANMQKFGQDLIERHVQQVQNVAQRIEEAYTATWDKQKSDWKQAFVSDPEIGGNRQATTVNAALDFIRTHGGTAEQQTEFRNLMESTGIGNHPAMIRLLAKANMAMSEGKPLPAHKPVPVVKSKTQTLYGGKTS